MVVADFANAIIIQGTNNGMAASKRSFLHPSLLIIKLTITKLGIVESKGIDATHEDSSYEEEKLN